MTETVIKIESNPYEECIRYYRLDGGWREITLATNPGSALHSEKLVHGFFPFKAEEIAKVIVGEFGSGDKIKLLFEGSDDEWEELKAICDESGFASTLYAVRSERHLANARDVLPEIIEVFKEIKPLVDDSVSQRKIVAEKIDRFTDVSSDIIPLCVLGNYSAGKSTFINALVGMEILPNGDEPVTARVFQIKRSKDRDRAMIQFSCGDRRFLLRFDPTGLMENKDLAGEALYDLIVTSAAKAETGMASQINAALKVLNSYRQGDGEEKVSDLIKLEVPFSDADPWPHDREFVIFDTPGSNSASNEDHARVLREAMEGLSNGLPIFVAEYSSLDSTDNEKLYREIEQIPAIDERFAMIVVNKADSADLPKGGFEDSDVAQIMHWSIPSNLYGQGIFFVSSILGLGSKNNGEFMSDNYAEKFEDQQRKYVDPASRFYKTLYRYDILPGQISRRTNKESEACKDLLLANSGLFLHRERNTALCRALLRVQQMHPVGSAAPGYHRNHQRGDRRGEGRGRRGEAQAGRGARPGEESTYRTARKLRNTCPARLGSRVWPRTRQHRNGKNMENQRGCAVDASARHHRGEARGAQLFRPCR